MTPQPAAAVLRVEDIGDVTVVNFVRQEILTSRNIQVTRAAIQSRGRARPAEVLLNFKNVEFLSSAALGKLITMNRKLQSAGGKLVLCEIDPQIYEVFEIHQC